MMEQIINELSANGSYPDDRQAIDGVERLLEISIKLRHYGFVECIRTSKDCKDRKLSNNLTISSWVIDRTGACNRDLQRHFLTFATKAPYIDDTIAEHEGDNKLFECKVGIENGLGLCLAHINKSFVLSLDCNSAFCNDYINVAINVYTNNATESNQFSILSIWDFDQVRVKEQNLRSILRDPVRTGDELVRRSKVLFPEIIICESALRQIRQLNGSETYFNDVIRHLSVLNDTMYHWTSGPYNPAGINHSVESGRTLDQFGDRRDFLCPDGEVRRFTLHSKIVGPNIRIHFFPLVASRLVYVGYVGTHLPTPSDRT